MLTHPKTESWQTPLIAGLHLDTGPLTTTLWFQPSNQFFTHLYPALPCYWVFRYTLDSKSHHSLKTVWLFLLCEDQHVFLFLACLSPLAMTKPNILTFMNVSHLSFCYWKASLARTVKLASVISFWIPCCRPFTFFRNSKVTRSYFSVTGDKCREISDEISEPLSMKERATKNSISSQWPLSDQRGRNWRNYYIWYDHFSFWGEMSLVISRSHLHMNVTDRIMVVLLNFLSHLPEVKMGCDIAKHTV